jgi:hypothetical protein
MLSISESTGSIFINGLCNRLKQEYSVGGVDVKELHAIFLELQNEMHNTEIHVEDKGNYKIRKQVVEYSSSLRYLIRFRASQS